MFRLFQMHRARTRNALVCDHQGWTGHLNIWRCCTLLLFSPWVEAERMQPGELWRQMRRLAALLLASLFVGKPVQATRRKMLLIFLFSVPFLLFLPLRQIYLQTMNDWSEVSRHRTLRLVLNLYSRMVISNVGLGLRCSGCCSGCESSCSHLCDCEGGGIRESAGKTNPFPAIWESHGFVVSFRRCSCNPTLPRSQVRSHPLLLLPPSAR